MNANEKEVPQEEMGGGSKRWRGKKRWPCHNNVSPIQALLGIESRLDIHHQKGTSPEEREISIMLGLCRSALESERRKGNQQRTLPGIIKGTMRKKN